MLRKIFMRMATGIATGLALTVTPIATAPARAATTLPPVPLQMHNGVPDGTLGAVFTPVAMKAYSPPHATLVMDFATGQILQQSHAQEARHPASLAKVMTLILVFDALRDGHLKLDQDITVSAHAAAQSPVKLGLKAGSTITVEDAIHLVATKSTNDMAVVLAEAVAGSESAFAQMMNDKAKALGMTATNFTNASGLPDKAQITTALDMARMTRALIMDYETEYHAYIGQRSVKYGGQTFASTNHLLGRYAGMDGVKTGFINDSGFNLIASAERDGRRIIGVVFGGPSARSRDNEMVRLLDQGFRTQPKPVIRPQPRPANLVIPPVAQNVPAAQHIDFGNGHGFMIDTMTAPQADNENAPPAASSCVMSKLRRLSCG